MSSHEEIMAVYESEITDKSRLVESKFGKVAFLTGIRGYHVENYPEILGTVDIKVKDTHKDDK